MLLYMSKFSPNTAFHSAADQPVTLAEILSALSFALDITEGARPGHSLRTCLPRECVWVNRSG